MGDGLKTIGNMIIMPNDLIKEIKSKYFEDDELSPKKVGLTNQDKNLTPYNTKIEFGKEDHGGAIRFLTKGQPNEEVVAMLARKYPKVKFAFLTVNMGLPKGMCLEYFHGYKKLQAKKYDLSTRQGRIIHMSVLYNMDKKKQEEKEL